MKNICIDYYKLKRGFYHKKKLASSFVDRVGERGKLICRNFSLVIFLGQKEADVKGITDDTRLKKCIVK